MCSDEKTDCINYRLLGKREPIGEWGHEYVRHLATEMSEDWKGSAEPTDKNKQRRIDLLVMAKEIIADNMKHNAEV